MEMCCFIVVIDCRVGHWGEWSAPFGFGTKTRTRAILQEPANGGQPCPELEQEAPAGMSSNI